MSTWIEWVEPWGILDEPVYCRVEAEAAIKVQKFTANQAKPGFVYESDEDALLDFMTIHWASRREE